MRLGAFTILALFLICGCGTGLRQVTIMTPFRVKNPTSDLSQIFLLGPHQSTCKQHQFKVYFTDPTNGFATYVGRFRMTSEIQGSGISFNSPSGSAVGLQSATDWMRDHSQLDTPISFLAPTDSTGTLKIQGVFFEPHSTLTNGTDCGISTSAMNRTYLVYREIELPKKHNGTISLDLSVAPAQVDDTYRGGGRLDPPILNPQGIPSSPGSNSAGVVGLACRNSLDRKSCHNVGLMELSIDTISLTNPGKLTVSLGNLNDPLVEEIATSTSAAQKIYAPRNKQFKLEYVTTGHSYEVDIDLEQGRIRFIQAGIEQKIEVLRCPVQKMWVTNLPFTTTIFTGGGSPTIVDMVPEPPDATDCLSPLNSLIIKDLGEGF